MAKGYEANKARQEHIASFGKELGRRAGFVCEWCGGKGDLRPQETDPVAEPEAANLLFLCADCRDLYGGARRDPERLRHMAGALWSPEPVVARSAAALLRRLGAAWAEETIELAGLDGEDG
ncbi:MAG TPA: hypothetical protein VGB12_10705 [bacterium]|jgi:hypothetical protein